jgi:hypothetical protein
MFIAIVQIPMAKWPRDAAVEVAAKSVPTYTALGAKPTVTYYDNHAVVDNETGRVHVDGRDT